MQLLESNTNTTKTMTSREMAELTEKRHDSVKRTIETLESGGVISKTQFVDGIKSANGVVEKVYLLGKRDSIIVVAQLCPEFTAKLVDRWQELESKQTPAIPQTYAAALLEAGRLATIVDEQTLQLEAQAPAVAYVENFVKCDGLIGVREAAKSLGLQQNAFVQMLIGAKIMYRENGHLQSYQSNIDTGKFVVKVVTDASGKARSSTMLTAKGIRWVAQKLELDKLFGAD